MGLPPFWAKKSVTDKKSVLPIPVAALSMIRDPKSQKGPYRDPVPKIGTLFGTVEMPVHELKLPIRYNPKQLWSLIHEHMVLSGLPKTAEMLRTEKDFVPLVPDSLPGPPVYPHTGLVGFHQI